MGAVGTSEPGGSRVVAVESRVKGRQMLTDMAFVVVVDEQAPVREERCLINELSVGGGRQRAGQFGEEALKG